MTWEFLTGKVLLERVRAGIIVRFCGHFQTTSLVLVNSIIMGEVCPNGFSMPVLLKMNG